jgi:nitrogen fixation protein
MANIKISQLTAKSTNLLATDLLEVSEVSGLTYVSKKITGQQIIDGIGLSNYVPYTGASANVNLGEYEIKVGQLTLDTSPTGTAAVGTTRWNNTLGSTETTLKGGSVILKNGVDLVARVVNKVTPNTTLTKAAYPVVKVSGAQGGRLAVAYAQANNDSNSADTLGVVTETIATNQEGFIITVGQLENINTTGSLQGETWADGDVLYLSPTIPGAITKVKPTGATGHIVIIGYVEYAHANNGKIYVKIMNGWELDELHNVYINTGTLANNDALIYESSTQLWKNKTIAQALGFTPENVANKSTNTSLGTSDTLYPTQNAVKTYADNLLGNANALVYKGTIDCSANPNYPAADAGWMYIASVAGKIGGASGVDVEVGDMIICNTDGSPSGNQATVGNNWNIIQKNIIGAVSGPGSSVNNNVAFFDGTTGKIIKDSGITLSGTNTGDQTLSGLGGVPTSRNITTNSPLSGGGDLTTDRTLSIADAAADGATKGAASFSASDFNSTSGNISIDYTNGQSASSSTKGFLTAGDWSTFDGKVNTGAITGSGLTMATSRLLGRTTASSGAVEEITVGSGLSLTGGTLSTAPSVQSVASATTVTPTFANDLVKITAQTVALTLAAPTGTAIDGKDLVIRIKDNGSAQTITWTSGTGGYRAIGVTLPTTTTAGKTTYVGLIYNSDDSVWDAIGVTTQA